MTGPDIWEVMALDDGTSYSVDLLDDMLSDVGADSLCIRCFFKIESYIILRKGVSEGRLLSTRDHHFCSPTKLIAKPGKFAKQGAY